jgi:DNA-binding response OmpR family regulator
MPNFQNLDRATQDDARVRRVLVCASGGGGASFAARLAASGYEVQSVSADAAVREVENFAPEVLIVEVRGATDGDSEPLALARRLRASHATAHLPLIVVFGDARSRSRAEAGETVRSFALEVGADDCFALSTPAPEALARLDALFWRIAAGRDLLAAHAADARRAEIESFVQLLDSARAEIDAGASGALALFASLTDDDGNDGHDRDADEGALRAAHEFFRRNLRRADAIAFYGPRLLLAHLARPSSVAARADVARLHAEFSHAHPRTRIAVGVVQFPEDGTEIEELIARAEASLDAARRDFDSEGTAEAEGTTALRDDVRGDPCAASEIGVGVSVDESAAKSDGISMRFEEPPAAVDEDDAGARLAASDGEGTQGGAASLVAEGARAQETAAREGATTKRAPRALRESSRGESFETSILPMQSAPNAGGVLARDASEAAARERELRTRGARMPRRLLLTVSDPARMAQVNLLLRSASYEVRAAFDGSQALDLLRIERADLLLLDLELKHFDGLEVLRRLNERHRGRLPLPVLLLHPRTEEGARACDAAHALGARGFVALPYDPAQLLEAVREIGGKD